MRQSFIDRVVEELNQAEKSLSDIVFVLPSRRAGTFLKNSIAKQAEKTILAPQIYSIEQFVERVSSLQTATPIEQLFTLYQAYQELEGEDQESFLDFSSWARTLLGDFDEIDRYLIDHTKVFSYLSAITEVNHWYVRSDKTPLIKRYISFWNKLEPLYKNFRKLLNEKGKAHQGLVYRTALEQLDEYLAASEEISFVFLGFNALNEAESNIIQKMLNNRRAEIFWDLDRCFLEESYHDAGYFIRRYLKQWKYYQGREMRGLSEEFYSNKDIRIIGIPKNVSQAKYIGHLLEELSKEDSRLSNTALVLGDESLLNPILNSLPATLDQANITMGYPLKNASISSLFNLFFELYLESGTKGWHYKKAMNLLSLPFIQLLLDEKEKEAYTELQAKVYRKNIIRLTPEFLENYFPKAHKILFNQANYIPKDFLENCLLLIQQLRGELEIVETNSLELEELYVIYTVFNQLKEMSGTFSFIDDLPTLRSIFWELMDKETLDFQGEPLVGLQIMGMLESRVLDFDTVIISSLNEGILPAGKQGHSFIPYDVKKELGLPTYKEKDAIYTYHFYRLLQRANNIYLVYNTEPDVLLGGEPSRLIYQLLNNRQLEPYIQQQIATMEISTNTVTPRLIKKDKDLYEAIKEVASHGFSPTSLTQYIRDPIDFYKKSVLKIEDSPTVDETIAATTFGTIIHNALEELLSPLIGKPLNPNLLKTVRPKIREAVKKYFRNFYPESSLDRGKNSIAFQMIIRSIENYIALEMDHCQQYDIKILALEKDLAVDINIPELSFPIRLKGKIDRVDEVNGELRIMDYKTGRVVLSEMNLTNWEELSRDVNLNKAFQVLCYAYMYCKQYNTSNLEAGVISFKNLSAGFLSFATKESRRSRDRDSVISPETLTNFELQLQRLIKEICNPELDLVEKLE